MNTTTSSLPTFVAAPAVMPANGTIPLGVTESGEFSWNPDSEPHILLAGRTRSGKTSLVRTIVNGLSQSGAEIILIDPKRCALTDVESLPGVWGRVTSSDIGGITAAIAMIEQSMYERYDWIARGNDPARLHRIALVVDEGRMLYEITKTYWSSVEKPALRRKGAKPVGSEHPCIEQIRSILRLGGEARVSVVLISQQADASWLSTEARQNLGVRVALGSMDDEGLGMMFGRRNGVADLPTNPDGSPIKGRAYAAISGSKPVQMQSFWTEPIPPVVTLAVPTPQDAPQKRKSILERFKEGWAEGKRSTT